MKRALLGLTLTLALAVGFAAFWLVHEIDKAAMEPERWRARGKM